MANWVKGKLKIRRKPEDIKRWVEECLHCYFTKWFKCPKSTMWISACMDMKWVWSSTGKLRSWRADLSRTGESNLRTTNGNALIRRLEGER